MMVPVRKVPVFSDLHRKIQRRSVKGFEKKEGGNEDEGREKEKERSPRRFEVDGSVESSCTQSSIVASSIVEGRSQPFSGSLKRRELSKVSARSETKEESRAHRSSTPSCCTRADERTKTN